MSAWHAAVLRVILSFPRCWDDRAVETPAEFADRASVIAEAISRVSESADGHRRDAMAGLLTIGYFESRFCRRIHEGTQHFGPGRGLWQLERGSRRPLPYDGLGLYNTRHAAEQALWLWRHSYQCGSGLRARFTAYAGRPCVDADRGWSTLADRVVFYRNVHAQLAGVAHAN